MEAKITEVMQSSIAFENENDHNCLHDNGVYQKLDQGLELNEHINVVGCVQKKDHQFYFLKYWPYEDQTLKSRIEEAEKRYKRITSEAWAFADKFTERLLDQRNAFTELRCLRSRCTAYTLEWTINKLDQLQAALDKLNSAKNAYQGRDMNSCSSGELINSMLHRTNNLATEKKLLREINENQTKGAVDTFSPVVEFRLLVEIKQFNGCKAKCNGKKIMKLGIKSSTQSNSLKRREKAIANATQKGKIWNPLGTRNAIQAQMRHLNILSEELRKEHFVVKDKIKSLEKDLEIAEKDVRQFRKEFDDIKQRRDEIHRHILNLKRQQDEEKGRHCRYASILSNVRELAGKKNVKALEELSVREVDIFMSKWKKSKAFRYNYERSILTSLDTRQLSRDGRMRNLK